MPRELLSLTMACLLLAAPPSTSASEDEADMSDEEAVWLDMTQAELDAAYDQAVYAPNLEQVLARQVANSAIAREVLGPPLRFAYGENTLGGIDEGLDVYPSDVADSPILIYVHGGTWRLGVSADNAFAAEAFVREGINFVVPDFASVDEFGGSLEGLVDQLERAVAWVYGNADTFGGDPDRIFLAGFSSGAHLAGVLLTRDWPALGLPGDVFKGALLCSGMYDLTPVALSWRGDYVSLGEGNIPSLSPQMNIGRISTPLLIAHGTLETPEFQRQAREFSEALENAGLPAALIVGEQYNHFEMIETLGNPYGVLGRPMLRMINGE